MPPTNPRIVVVDDNNGIFNIVRAALELLGRHPRLIETHSGDDALMEIRVLSPDLLVTAHTLAGTTNGPMLALMAKRELAALPIIVMGQEHDPILDDETLSQSPFQYLRKPMAPEAFIRALRIALDGPQAVPEEHTPEEMSAPVPAIDADRLKPMLFQLLRDVGAMAAVLADRNGKVITFEGAAGYIDRDLLAAALGPGFGSVTKLLPVIGEQPRVLKHFDGEKGDLFGLGLGLHHFIMLVFDGNAPASALGNVKRFGGNAVNAMLEVIGVEQAFGLMPVVAAPAATPAPAPGKKSRRTQEMAAAPAPAKPAAPARGKTGPLPKRASEPVNIPAHPQMDPIENFDPSLLDALASIDLNAADDMFSPDKLAQAASGDGSKISFEDAMMQGIIGDVEE